jgi:hypothetical protein
MPENIGVSMAAESLIVTLSDGTTDLTFYKASQNGYASRYSWDGNTVSNRLFIDVDHKPTPLGSSGADVHTLTLRREALDNDTQKVFVSKVSLQVSFPKTDTISVANIGNDITSLMCLLSKNFTPTFIVGATPSGDYHVDGAFVPART